MKANRGLALRDDFERAPSRYLPILLLMAALAHGGLYVALIPPWQAPDEIAHFEYARLLAERRRALTSADASPELEQQIIESLYTFRAWTHVNRPPPAQVPTRLADVPFFGRSRTLARFSWAYVPYALAVWPFLQHDLITQLMIMRWVSVALGAGVALLAFQTARLVAPEDLRLATGAALVVLFLPQHAFILASVNDGNLAELLASIAVYLLLMMLRKGFTWPKVGFYLVALILAIQTKRTAYYLIPLTLIIGLAVFLQRIGLGRIHVKRRLGWLVLSAGILLGVGVVPRLLVDSTLLPLQPVSLLGRIVEGEFLEALWNTFRSFWGVFGWMSFTLPSAWYNFCLALLVLALIGLVRRARDGWRRNAAAPMMYATVGLGALLPIVALLSWFVTSPIGLDYYQGRYLFAGIVPLALGLVAGWLAWLPPRPSLWVLLVGLVLLDTLALWNYAMPFFYG